MLRVVKFGGSSVGNAAAFKRVGNILTHFKQRRKETVVAVFSAMMSVTNRLLSASEAATRGDMKHVTVTKDFLFALHRDSVLGLGLSSARRSELLDWLDLSMNDDFLDSCEIVAKLGFCTGGLPCVTGFIGADRFKTVTTLGRGGSDLSAAVIGNVLDADEVTMYKVESVTAKDGTLDSWKPGWIGIIPKGSTETIPFMSYEEATYLKKVLHPATCYPLMEKAIPVRVGNTLEYLHPGTLISNSASPASAHRSLDALRTHTQVFVVVVRSPMADAQLCRI